MVTHFYGIEKSKGSIPFFSILGMYYNGIIEYSQYSDPRSIRGLSTGI